MSLEQVNIYFEKGYFDSGYGMRSKSGFVLKGLQPPTKFCQHTFPLNLLTIA
jgi:hypothetical protein